MEIKVALSTFKGIIILLEILFHCRLVISSATVTISWWRSQNQSLIFSNCSSCPVLLFFCITDTKNSPCLTQKEEMKLLSNPSNVSFSIMKFVNTMYLKVQGEIPMKTLRDKAVYGGTSTNISYVTLESLNPHSKNGNPKLGPVFGSIYLEIRITCDSEFFGANCDLTVPLQFKGHLEKSQRDQIRDLIRNITVNVFGKTTKNLNVKIDYHKTHTLENEPVSQLYPVIIDNSSQFNQSQTIRLLRRYTGKWHLPAPVYTGKTKSFTTHIPNDADENQPKPSKILYILFVVFLFATFLLTALGFLIRHYRNKQRHIRMQNGGSSFSLTSMEDNAFPGKKGSKQSAEFCNPIYRYKSAEKSPHAITKNNHHNFRSAHQKHTKNKPSVTTMQEDIEDIANNSVC